MLFRLLILFIVAAIAEVGVLVLLVRETGLLPTIAILLLAGVLGTILARHQGLRAWRAIRTDLAAGRPPATTVIDGVMILFAGFLLLLPGLLTDVAGILLLIPQVRSVLRVPLLAYLTSRFTGRLRTFASRASGQGEVIDAEFRRADAPSLEDRTPR